MEEGNPLTSRARKLGKGGSCARLPVPQAKSPVYSSQSETGFQEAVNQFESRVWNLGYTRPPNRRPRPFSEDDSAKAYLSYFAAGDMHAYRHGRKVRLEGSTTQLAQLRLLFDLLSANSKPMVYVIKNPWYFREWSRYAWRAVFDLDESFSFLVPLPEEVSEDVLSDDESFYAALGGFSDAEGYISLSRCYDGKSTAVFGLSNSNMRMCSDFLKGLRQRGFSGALSKLRDIDGQIQWQLTVSPKDVMPVIARLSLRHEEKTAARTLVGKLDGTRWAGASLTYRGFRSGIKVARNRCVLAAKREYENRDNMKQIKIQLEKEITRRAHSLHVAGLRPEQIATLLGRSQRTIYRRVARENNRVEGREAASKQIDQ